MASLYGPPRQPATSSPLTSTRVAGRTEPWRGSPARFVVLVDPADAPNVNDRDKVEVFDSRKISLGEYEVQTARLLDFVDAIRIEV